MKNGSHVVVNMSTIRLMIAMSVAAGWAANDVHKPEAERREMPPDDIEACVDGVLSELRMEAKRTEIKTIDTPRIYTPGGGLAGMEH